MGSITLPLFNVPFCDTEVPFRVHIEATQVHCERGGHNFKTAQGRGALAPKCEAQHPATIPSLTFSFVVSNGDGNGCLTRTVTHNFQTNPKSWPPDEEFDLLSAVDPTSGTCQIRLQVYAIQLVT